MRFRAPKNALFRKFRTFPPKTRFCRTFPLWTQKEQKNHFGPLLGPKSLIFPREFNDSGYVLFSSKSSRSAQKKRKIFSIVTRGNAFLAENSGKLHFHPFRQERKTLYKRNVLGTFFGPESQKCDFSAFGRKKAKFPPFSASGPLFAPKTPQNGKVRQKPQKGGWTWFGLTI